MGPAPQSTTPPPGWYPDPWYPGSMRYWDGLTWTSHAQAAQAAAPVVRVDPRTIHQWALRIPLAFWAMAACEAISAVAAPIVFGRAFDDALDSSEPTSVGFGSGFGFGLGSGSLALNVLSLGSLAATVAMMVWGHHITSTARSLGLRTTHSPGWAAAGWIVPIISLWFPYQTVRDALPLGHPGRNMAGYWWGLHIATAVIAFIAMLFAFASPGAGALVGAFGAVTALGAGYYGHELATAIGKTHLDILGRVAGVTVSGPL